MKETLKDLKHRLSADITEIPPLFRSNYLPALDGFRGISILMVLLFHVLIKLDQFWFNGVFGVEIFFVISGFIITTLLVRERLTKKELSLRKFYIRRAIKIIPVAYIYLLFVTLINLHGQFLSRYDLLSAALFIKNTEFFITFPDGFVGHFWSVSVEEQYYLLFPFILKRSIRAYFFVVILLLLVIIPSLLILEKLEIGIFTKRTMQNVLDLFCGSRGILVGSLFSLLVYKKVIISKFYSNKLIFNLLLIALAYICYTCTSSFYVSLVTTTISSVLIAVVIVNNIFAPEGSFFRFLNSKFLVTIGLASYSLYIWQQIFLLGIPWRDAFDYADSLWLNLPAAILVGFSSYYFVEKRLAKWRTKFR